MVLSEGFLYLRGYETIAQTHFLEGGLEIVLLPKKGDGKHFPRANGTVRNILVFSLVGYETFTVTTKKTLQQGMQVKK